MADRRPGGALRPASVLLALAAAAAPLRAGEPWVPTDPRQVLERLPIESPAAQAELAKLRTRLKAAPDDLDTACQLVRRLVSLGRAQADPRFFGYAQVALAPWWSLPEPPPEVLVLRAILEQAGHDFVAAQADLDKAVARAPGSAQAWLTRAVVQQVRGDLDGALQSCSRLLRTADELVMVGCVCSAASLRGRAEASYQMLSSALSRAPAGAAAERDWAVGLLAEMAERLGKAADAERWYRASLAAGRNAYMLAAFADFLLDQGRPAEVVELLAGENRVDALALRSAEAGKALGRPDWQALRADLGRRFDNLRARGDRVHQREEARFRLHLCGDAPGALALARENWEIQEEPADARILLEAALAAGQPEAARPAAAWCRKLGLEDGVLAGLLARMPKPGDGPR